MNKKRTEQIEQLGNSLFDLCIIGGGATGAGCALDAASRGLRVVLIEQEDFGSATSSKSTKLIHGGVRYLEQAVKKLSMEQFKMVRKALQERSTLLKIAPHITRPLQLITPCRTWVEGMYYFIGLKIYDWISSRTTLGGSELLGKKKALEKIPSLRKENIFSAVLYYDGQLDDLRFNLALVQTAQTHGALCINHIETKQFEKDDAGRLKALWVKDKLLLQDIKVNAKVFINATGPFADKLRQMANGHLLPRMRVSKGVHILLPKQMMNSSSALLIPQTRDGRVLFAIPYQKHLLVGTTDDEAQLTEEDFGPTAEEVKYLLEYINEYLDVQATHDDVVAGFGGLRPLVMQGGGNTKDLVRDHEVEEDELSGLISILGGKWTTYRLMAKDTVDAAASRLNMQVACATVDIKLVGSKQYSHATAIQLQQQTGWDHELIKHLTSKYGDQSEKIAAISKQYPKLAERILPGMPYTYAELQYVIEEEMAFTVKDVLCRRWGTQLADWNQTLQLIPHVGQFMTQYFGWNEAQQREYIDGYVEQLHKLKTAMQSLS